MGRYGRQNVFLACPENNPQLRIATDLQGFTTVPYDPSHSRGLVAGTGPAVRRIREAIENITVARRLIDNISLRAVGPPGKVTFPLKMVGTYKPRISRRSDTLRLFSV